MVCKLHKKEAHKKHLHVLHKHEEGFHDPKNEIEPESDDKCPYCADDEDNRTDDCAYCQDLDAEENADGTAGMHDCPACKQYDASQQNTGGIDDCPYCQQENITESQANPEQPQDHICNCPDCVANKKDETNLGVEDMAAERPDNCPECQKMYGDAVENQPDQTGQTDPNMQGHETAEEVLDMLDQEPGAGGQTPAEAAKKIDNTELPQGDQMKENTSVPENFGDKQKNDVSDSELAAQNGGSCDCPSCPKGGDHSQDADPAMAAQDPAAEDPNDQPDMTGVLQSGLDEHANEQKKQQVLDMVGQTLAGFKANKASLEATKEQNQALYNSCIQMLKSMISLCDLLGLKPKPMANVGQNGAPEPAEGNGPAPGKGPSQSPPSEDSPAPKAVA
jgi:hypothetical protein